MTKRSPKKKAVKEVKGHVEEQGDVLKPQEETPNVAPEVNVPEAKVADVIKEKPKEPVRRTTEMTIAERIAESRKVLDTPLQPGQAFYESPEGEILIGEKGKDRAWSRTMNGGKGGWANARR